MKSMNSGTNSLWSKISTYISLIQKNCKMETLIVILIVVWPKIAQRFPGLSALLAHYFSESRCAGIAGFAAVIIGIYATVWSIFATSASKINAKLLKSKVEGQLFFLISIGLIEAFITTIQCVFVQGTVPYYAEIAALFTLLTTISFAKFVAILMRITKLNITYIVQEIDAENAKCTEVQVKIDEIYHRTIDK